MDSAHERMRQEAFQKVIKTTYRNAMRGLRIVLNTPINELSAIELLQWCDELRAAAATVGLARFALQQRMSEDKLRRILRLMDSMTSDRRKWPGPVLEAMCDLDHDELALQILDQLETPTRVQ